MKECERLFAYRQITAAHTSKSPVDAYILKLYLRQAQSSGLYSASLSYALRWVWALERTTRSQRRASTSHPGLTDLNERLGRRGLRLSIPFRPLEWTFIDTLTLGTTRTLACPLRIRRPQRWRRPTLRVWRHLVLDASTFNTACKRGYLDGKYSWEMHQKRSAILRLILFQDRARNLNNIMSFISG